MEASTGAVKALTEKLPGILNPPILLRVLLPGSVTVAWLWPFLPPGLQSWTWSAGAWIVIIVFAVGILMVLFDTPIYQLYEGYIFWPARLFSYCTRRLDAKVREKLEEVEKLDPEDDPVSNVRHETLWEWLRLFPSDKEGNPVAKFPTRLGNVLASYEDYPENRYGMDAAFYWPRLWLVVEPEKKKKIDSDWAVADGLLYVSLLCGLGFAVHLVRFAIERSTASAIFVVLLAVASHVAYRVSLPFHQQNGENFKALFDLYRGKLYEMGAVTKGEKRRWRATWLYLQYLSIECTCGEQYPADKDKCPNPRCQRSTEDNIAHHSNSTLMAPTAKG